MSAAPSELWPPVFSGALFDFDGTLADTAMLWREVDLAFFAKRGLTYTEDYARTLSELGFEAGARYTIDRYGLKEGVQEICDEWNRMGRALYASRVSLRRGAERYIRTLRNRGIPCALVTTNDHDVLDSMKPRVDVDALFDARVHAAEVAHPKTHPDIYLEAAQRLGVAPASCIVFEDLPQAIRSAHRGGFLTCGVASGDPIQHVDELRREADLFLEHWYDIPLPATTDALPN